MAAFSTVDTLKKLNFLKKNIISFDVVNEKVGNTTGTAATT